MSFDDLQSLWQTPENQPSAASRESMRTHFLTTLRARQRRVVLFLGFVVAGLLVPTTLLLASLLRPASGAGKDIDAVREWSVFLLLALPWIGAGIFVRQFLRHRQLHPHPDQSIHDCLRALLDENRLARLRYLGAAALNGAMLLLMPVIVRQLQASGKAGNEIVVPAFVVLPGLLLVIFVSLGVHYRRRLLPEKRSLETLLAAYAE
jgi:hypothetical protein